MHKNLLTWLDGKRNDGNNNQIEDIKNSIVPVRRGSDLAVVIPIKYHQQIKDLLKAEKVTGSPGTVQLVAVNGDQLPVAFNLYSLNTSSNDAKGEVQDYNRYTVLAEIAKLYIDNIAEEINFEDFINQNKTLWWFQSLFSSKRGEEYILEFLHQLSIELNYSFTDKNQLSKKEETETAKSEDIMNSAIGWIVSSGYVKDCLQRKTAEKNFIQSLDLPSAERWTLLNLKNGIGQINSQTLAKLLKLYLGKDTIADDSFFKSLKYGQSSLGFIEFLIRSITHLNLDYNFSPYSAYQIASDPTLQE